MQIYLSKICRFVIRIQYDLGLLVRNQATSVHSIQNTLQYENILYNVVCNSLIGISILIQLAFKLETIQLPPVSREVASVVVASVICEAAVAVVCDVAAVAVVFDETAK